MEKQKLSENQKMLIKEIILEIIRGANGKFNRNSKKRTKTKSHTTFIIAKNKDIFYVYQYRTNLNNTPATKIWLLKYNGIMYNTFIKTIQKQIQSNKVGVIYE